MEARQHHAAVRRSRNLVLGGDRVTFRVRYRPTDDGCEVEVVDLGAHLHVTSRKGVEGAARSRISLELEVPEDAFDVELETVRTR